MDFALTEEQALLRQTAGRWFRAHCDKAVIRRLEAEEDGFSVGLWRGLADLGWLGLLAPEAHGGSGLSLLEAALVMEESGKAAFDSPLANTLLVVMAVAEFGSPAQKERFLPAAAAGDSVLTVAMQEHYSAFDPTSGTATASRVPGGYELTGTKAFVPYAAVADLALVSAHTLGSAGDPGGVSVFLVDLSAPGVHRRFTKTLDPAKRYEVTFDRTPVREEDRLGAEGDGAPIASRSLAWASALRLAEMVGVADQQLAMAAAYVKEREQFDRPIGTFQAVQHRLADMFTDLQAARWTAYQAIAALAQGADAVRELAVAGAVIGDACQRISFGAQQLHGGIGVDLEYDLHFYFRKAKALELLNGSSHEHVERLAALLDDWAARRGEGDVVGFPL